MGKMPIERVWEPPVPSPPEKGGGKKGIDRERLKKACTDFEALFIQQVLKFMRQAAPSKALLGNSPGTDLYQSLMDQELSNNLAKRSGIGLGEMLYRQILRRERTEHPSAPEPTFLSLQGTEVEERRKENEGIRGPSSHPLSDHGRGRPSLSFPDPED
jgi:flagellar protein FlgJ